MKRKKERKNFFSYRTLSSSKEHRKRGDIENIQQAASSTTVIEEIE
jgi:hypothetical protein